MVYTVNRQGLFHLFPLDAYSIDLIRTISSLTPEQKQHPNIKHALEIRACTARADYQTFFRLYYAAPDMSAYLLDKFVDRERVRAMLILCRAFRPTLSIDYLARTLGFLVPTSYTLENGELQVKEPKKYKKGKKLCVKWLDSENVVWMDATTKEAVNTKDTLGTFVNRASEVLQKVDIKGQIH